MNAIGKVEAILDDRLVLLSSHDALNEGEIVSVYSIIDDPKLKEIGVAEPIIYPKGQLRVIFPQEGNKYLAERFREVKKRTRIEVVPSPLAQNIVGLFAQLRPETKEITEEIPGSWSAELNKNESLNIFISKIVSIGDLIGMSS